MPTMRGRNQLEAASGTMPRWENTKPKRAASRRDPDVHRELHGDADADGRPVHGGDHWLQGFEDAQRQLAAAVAHLRVAVIGGAAGQLLHRPAPRVAVEGVGAGGEVGAGAEAAACAGDDDGADIVVLVGGIEGVDHLLHHLAGEGVELVRPVQGDGEDLLGYLVFDRLIRHGISFRSLFDLAIERAGHARSCAKRPHCLFHAA